MGMASSSIVLIRTEPLSFQLSTVYGPSHLVLSFPLNLYTLNHTTVSNLLPGIVSLSGVCHAIFSFEAGLPLGGEGPAIFIHPIHLAEVTFPFVHG